MIFPTIRGNKLDGYLLGTKLCPEVFIIEGFEQKINPAFEEWVTMDQLLLGWLSNTMSVGVTSQVLGCKTSQELWKNI